MSGRPALLVAPGLSSPRDHALISLLALNGPRVSEAIGVDIEHLALERATAPWSSPARAAKSSPTHGAPYGPGHGPSLGERCEGPVFLDRRGDRLDRHAAGRIVRRLGRKAGIARIGPHTLRHAFITAALDAGVLLRDVQERPATPILARRCATTGPGCRWIAAPPTSWLPSWPAPAAERPGEPRRVVTVNLI